MQLDAYLLHAYADASGKQTKHEFMNDEDTWYRCFVRSVTLPSHPSAGAGAGRASSSGHGAPGSNAGPRAVPTVELLCREFSPGKTVSAPRRFKNVPQRFLRPADGGPCALNLDFEVRSCACRSLSVLLPYTRPCVCGAPR